MFVQSLLAAIAGEVFSLIVLFLAGLKWSIANFRTVSTTVYIAAGKEKQKAQMTKHYTCVAH